MFSENEESCAINSRGFDDLSCDSVLPIDVGLMYNDHGIKNSEKVRHNKQVQITLHVV